MNKLPELPDIEELYRITKMTGWDEELTKLLIYSNLTIAKELQNVCRKLTKDTLTGLR